MNRSQPRITVESSLYLALFALALFLRLYQLNAHPLADAEAREALTVYRFLGGQAAASLPHSPAYFFFTYFGFLLFGASEAMARLAPALCGAGLVLLPAFFRERLGRVPALLAAGLMGISAVLMAASRTADGAIIALLGLGLGLGGLRRYLTTSSVTWLVIGAAALGAGLAGGAAFLTGALVLTATALVVMWTSPADRTDLRGAVWKLLDQRWTFAVTLALTAGVVSTVGLLYRPGLGALADSWAAWLSGGLPSAAGRAPQILLLFLFANEPFVLIFGVIGAAQAFTTANRAGQWLFWSVLVGLAVVLVRGGREMADLVWVAAPLAGLAGWGLAQAVGSEGLIDRETRPIVAAQVAIVVVLLSFSIANTASFAEQVRLNPALTQNQITFSGLVFQVTPLAYLAMSTVALALVALTSYLIGLGWSPRPALQGLTLGIALALLAMNLRAAWGVTQLRAASPVELWWERPVADDLKQLMQTAETVSNYAVGSAHDVELTVQGDPDAALGWAFRDFPHATFVDRLEPLVTSPMVVAPAEEQNPTLGSAYVGQAFTFRASWTPALSWTEWVGWLAFRRAPVQSEQLILWVREDVQQLRTP